MKAKAKALRSKVGRRKASAGRPSQDASERRPQRERVLIEFPAELLQQADEAARALHRNRSDLIRCAVETLLDDMEAKKFEAQLAAAYAANSTTNRELCEEFGAVDREGF